MQIDVTGRHVEVTEALRAYCVDKVAQALADVPRVARAHVILSVERHVQAAEVVLHALHHEVEAKAESDDLYASIDRMADKLSRRVEKLRDRATDHKGQARPPMGP
jgi:putative sigma-54 modulation protein